MILWYSAMFPNDAFVLQKIVSWHLCYAHWTLQSETAHFCAWVWSLLMPQTSKPMWLLLVYVLTMMALIILFTFFLQPSICKFNSTRLDINYEVPCDLPEFFECVEGRPNHHGWPFGERPEHPSGNHPGHPTGHRPGHHSNNSPGHPSENRPGRPPSNRPGFPSGGRPGSPVGTPPISPYGSRPRPRPNHHPGGSFNNRRFFHHVFHHHSRPGVATCQLVRQNMMSW